MNPTTKVTDPQTIRASEAPRSSEANPAGVTGGIARLAGWIRRGGGGDGIGWSEEEGMARWGERRMVKRREQSSKKRLDWLSSSLDAIIVVEMKTLTLTLTKGSVFIGVEEEMKMLRGSRGVDKLRRNSSLLVRSALNSRCLISWFYVLFSDQWERLRRSFPFFSFLFLIFFSDY